MFEIAMFKQTTEDENCNVCRQRKREEHEEPLEVAVQEYGNDGITQGKIILFKDVASKTEHGEIVKQDEVPFEAVTRKGVIYCDGAVQEKMRYISFRRRRR
ncbi:hypothetical protein TNCV_4376891 [Trichonephila clavipes]|nr:hypothetical protein TNCV_4376891 [Trichonephila clavipes]